MSYTPQYVEFCTLAAGFVFSRIPGQSVRIPQERGSFGMSLFLVRRSSLLFIALLLGAHTVFAAYPTARVGTQLVYHETIGRSVLFGGMTRSDSSGKRYDLNDTWEWTGGRWLPIYPTESPSARNGQAMVYDAARQRVLIFGGAVHEMDGSTQKAKAVDDMWAYGTDRTWTQLTPATRPPVRAYAAAAYDRAHDRFLLYGGTNYTDDLHDTWEFDGTTWHQLATDTPKLSAAVMAYDEARDRVLLLGNVTTTTANTVEMYVWESNAWQKKTPEKIPACVTQSRMVWQESNGKVLLLGGGCGGSSAKAETWEWDGTDWTQVTFATGAVNPGLVYGEGMAYDRARDEAVMFGGFEYETRNSTWVYKDGTWTNKTAALKDTPGPRSFFVFENDPVRNAVWLFGGHSEEGFTTDLWRYQYGQWQPVEAADAPATCSYPTGTFDTDRNRLVILCEDSGTFEFDGEAWHKYDTAKTKPPARRWSSMVYDPTLRKSVMFGGYLDVIYSKETWTWDGTTWTRVAKDSSPSARSQMAMFYDPSLRKVVLFGGIGRANSDEKIIRYNDMHQFEGTKWTQLKTVANLPSPRYGSQVRFDPISGKVIMFGGKNELEQYLNEQWEWNGTTWTKLTPENPPPPRMNGQLVFDPSTQKMTLFGGYAGQYFSELWTLSENKWQFVQPAVTLRRRAVR